MNLYTIIQVKRYIKVIIKKNYEKDMRSQGNEIVNRLNTLKFKE